MLSVTTRVVKGPFLYRGLPVTNSEWAAVTLIIREAHKRTELLNQFIVNHIQPSSTEWELYNQATEIETILWTLLTMLDAKQDVEGSK